MENVILVVEGKNDYSRIKQIYPNLDILITGGSAISEKFLSDLKELAKTNKIVVFTAPTLYIISSKFCIFRCCAPPYVLAALLGR